MRLLRLEGAMTQNPSKDLPSAPDSPTAAPPPAGGAAPAAKAPTAPGMTGAPSRPREIGGPKGPEPTRYGDWEVGGRCSDF
jgi:hypothetical protein